MQHFHLTVIPMRVRKGGLLIGCPVRRDTLHQPLLIAIESVVNLPAIVIANANGDEASELSKKNHYELVRPWIIMEGMDVFF